MTTNLQKAAKNNFALISVLLGCSITLTTTVVPAHASSKVDSARTATLSPIPQRSITIAQALDFKFTLVGTTYSKMGSSLGPGKVTGVIQGLKDNDYSSPTSIVINSNSLGIPEGTVLVKSSSVDYGFFRVETYGSFAVENGKVLRVRNMVYKQSSEVNDSTSNYTIVLGGDESYLGRNNRVVNVTNGRSITGWDNVIYTPLGTDSTATENNRKCNLKAVFFLGYDRKSSGSGGESRVAPVDGMGALQRRLQGQISNHPNISLNSQVYRWDGENAAITDIESAIRNKKADSIVIVGHSFGADTASELADTLNSKGISVNILIQIDTVGYQDDHSPSNVTTLINYYQTNDKSIGVEYNIPKAENINANVQFDKTLTHTTIDDNEKLHQDIIKKILEKTKSCSEKRKSAN